MHIESDVHSIFLSAVSTQQNYVTVRNLKALALAKIGRFDDIIALCQGSLNHDTPDVEHKRIFTHDVVLCSLITTFFCLQFSSYKLSLTD